jgi:hypothetical protein
VSDNANEAHVRRLRAANAKRRALVAEAEAAAQAVRVAMPATWLRDIAPRPRQEGPGPLRMPAVERKEPKPLKKVNRERKKARLERDFGPQAKACRRMACCVCSRRPSDPHHYPSRGAGGRDDCAIPLCRRCHDEAHAMGMETFQRERGVSFDVVKGDIAAAMKSHTCSAWARLEDGGLRAVCSICEKPCEEPIP